jgi:hypothetical protein
MVMFARPVDVDGVRPGRDVVVLPADKQVSPAASAALARGLAFVTNEKGSGWGRSGIHRSGQCLVTGDSVPKG